MHAAMFSLGLPRGAIAALAAALLFGAGTPFAKLLLAHSSPWLLAALLYLGSGVGLALLRLVRRAPRAHLAAGEAKWLAGAVLAGGVIGPVLLMLGLAGMPAANASLLLNAEGVLTALLAWFVFKENFNRRIAFGMLAIVAGGVVLAWPGQLDWPGWSPALLVVGACLAWAVDNNLTRKVSLTDASWIAMVKGLAAGATNLVLASMLGASLPAPLVVAGAAVVGFASYGASLALFVVGLRELGTARTGAYFSVAPFFGAMLAIALLGEPLTAPLLAAGVLMAIGVVLHLSERHEHRHVHEPIDHTHEHVHGTGDVHHDHEHTPPVAPGTRHAHAHHHEPIAHSHPHFPDAHHRHEHSPSQSG
jgi:drug/metabolite transporter (DMT)-like permease